MVMALRMKSNVVCICTAMLALLPAQNQLLTNCVSIVGEYEENNGKVRNSAISNFVCYNENGIGGTKYDWGNSNGEQC